MIRYYLRLALLTLLPVCVIEALPLTASLVPPAPTPSDTIAIDVQSQLPNPCYTTPVATAMVSGN
ncbi:MAG: hypothetical protein ABIZ80_10950, partial [Bryobacteraceae bacterium]